MTKYFRIFIVSNVTILAVLLFLPALLFTQDISVIQNLIGSISND